jgi:hypothetical protein
MDEGKHGLVVSVFYFWFLDYFCGDLGVTGCIHFLLLLKQITLNTNLFSYSSGSQSSGNCSTVLKPKYWKDDNPFRTQERIFLRVLASRVAFLASLGSWTLLPSLKPAPQSIPTSLSLHHHTILFSIVLSRSTDLF